MTRTPLPFDIPELELPGMWEYSDFTGGRESEALPSRAVVDLTERVRNRCAARCTHSTGDPCRGVAWRLEEAAEALGIRARDLGPRYELLLANRKQYLQTAAAILTAHTTN